VEEARELAALMKSFFTKLSGPKPIEVQSFYGGSSHGLYKQVVELYGSHGIIFEDICSRAIPSPARIIPIPKFEGPLRQNVLDAFLIIDTYTTCIFSMFWTLYPSRFVEDEYSEQRLAACISLFKIYTDVLAYRKLFFSSLPEQANTIGRTISTCSDIVILSMINRDFAKDYIKAADEDEANHVWFSYLAKNKAKKAFSQYLNQDGGDTDGSEFVKWESQRERELGASVHSAAFSCKNAFYSYVRFPTGDNLYKYYEWVSTRSIPIVEQTLFKTLIALSRFIDDDDNFISKVKLQNNAKMGKEYLAVLSLIPNLIVIFEEKARENMTAFLIEPDENDK